MKIIVSGGGTGGHIYPALTLIRTLQQKVDKLEVLYVGTHAGLEADIIPKEGIPFATVDLQGFKRSLSPENLLRAARAIKGVGKAMGIVRKFQPDVVVGTGGYVCGPVLMAASLLGIPSLIQEQNVIPGITNKILSKFVNKIATGYQEANGAFPANKVVFTGNPIRQEVMAQRQEADYEAFDLHPGTTTILVSGGSRGARTINRAKLVKGVVARELGVSPAELEPATSRAPMRPIEMRVFAAEAKEDGEAVENSVSARRCPEPGGGGKTRRAPGKAGGFFRPRPRENSGCPGAGSRHRLPLFHGKALPGAGLLRHGQ